MDLNVLGLRNDGEVLGSVVRLVAVVVMDDLAGSQLASENSLSN